MAILPYPCRAVVKVGGDGLAVMSAQKSADVPAALGIVKAAPGCRGPAVVVLSVSALEVSRKAVF